MAPCGGSAGCRARLAPDDGAHLVGAAISRASSPPRETDRQASPRTDAPAGAYRTRVSVAVGAIALLLVAIPFVPALAGVGGSSVRYSYEPRLTPEVTGQFVTTKRGPVKLFAWQEPQASFPHDALRLHASDLDGLLVRAAAVDSPKAYQLFDLDHGTPVPLVVRGASARELVLSPGRSLRPGATRSSPRTRACSGGVTSPTSGRALRCACDLDQLTAARGRPCRARRAPAALRGARRARLRGAPLAFASPAPVRGEGAVGCRVHPVRRRGLVRSGGAASRLEPRALPRVLPGRGRSDRGLPRRGFGLAPAAQARP